MDNNLKPNLRHRKYIEKKVDSTGGSEIENYKKPISPKRTPSPSSPKSFIRKNSSHIKQIRGRRYISALKYAPKEVLIPRTSHSRPSKIKMKKIPSKSQTKRSRKTNKSVDLKLIDIRNSFRSSPKIKDPGLIYKRIG